LELNGTHQLLVYADGINLLGNNINTIKENTETHLRVSKDIGLEINVENTKYMIMSHHQNSGQNQITRIANKKLEIVAKFKYLRMTQIKMTCVMKARADQIQGMLAIVQSESFCLHISYKKKTKY
jgi:hypothetical protein